MRANGLFLLVGLFLGIAPDGGSLTADDSADASESQEVQLHAIEECANILARLSAGDFEPTVLSQALQTLVQGLFSEDESVSAAAIAALERRVPHPIIYGSFPWDQGGYRIEDPRALGLIRAVMVYNSMGIDAGHVWRWCRPRILMDNADMRKAGAWTALRDDPASAILFLQELVRDEDHEVRLCAMHLLGFTCLYYRGMVFEDYAELGTSMLQERVGDSHELVRSTAYLALSGFVYSHFKLFPTLPRNAFRAPRSGRGSAFTRRLIEMAESDVAEDRFHALNMLTYFDQHDRESVDVIVRTLEEAAAELQSGEVSDVESVPSEANDSWPIIRWPSGSDTTAYEIIDELHSDVCRMLDIALTTPEGVAAIHHLRDAVNNNIRLRTRCTVALFCSGHLAWDECRDEICDAITVTDEWFTQEILSEVVTSMDDASAATFLRDIDSQLGTRHADEVTVPENDLVLLVAALQSPFRRETEPALAFQKLQLPGEIDPLIEFLNQPIRSFHDGDPSLMVAALEKLSEAGEASAAAIPAVIAVSQLPMHTVEAYPRARAIRCLGHIATSDNAEAIDTLRHHLRNGGLSIRTEAAFALARLGVVDNEVLSELEWLETNGPFQLREQYLALLDSLADESE